MRRRILAVLLDFGDTLADQASERRDESGFVYDVDLMPGARELLVVLRERGYRVALVADGRADESTVLRARHDLDALIDAVAISDEVGAEKPDRRIFEAALQRLGLAPAHVGRVVMVGNRLERDVRGANDLGMVSVWIDWSPRYRKIALSPGEVADHVIHEPLQLLDVLDRLNASNKTAE
jgi:FMN phosphatase YigB (HAD superfamily)